MTGEERKDLVRWLRNMHHAYSLSEQYKLAADEIERLMGEVKNWELWARSQPSYQDQVAALAQSDAEPVALQNAIAEVLRAEFDGAGPDDMITYLKSQSHLIASAIVRQIYTLSPRSDASAGLIEAADNALADDFERLVKIIGAWRTSLRTTRWIAQQINEAGLLRSRAADRSGK